MTETSTEIKVEEDGAYKVCFDNSYSMYHSKVVYFDLGIDENNKTKVDHSELFDNLNLEKDDREDTKEIIVRIVIYIILTVKHFYLYFY